MEHSTQWRALALILESICSSLGYLSSLLTFLQVKYGYYLGFFVDKIKRKKSMMILNAIAGSMCLLFILKAVQDSKTLQIIIVPFSRFLLSKVVG